MRLPNSLKRLTTPLVGRIPVTITGGENRGRKWSLACSGSGLRSGTREAERMSTIAALIRGGDVVWDVGAHYGSITLFAARRAGAKGEVHAFEPSSYSRHLLTRHVVWNHLENAAVHPYALSSFDGEASFGGSDSSFLFALGQGDERVSVRTAASIVRSGLAPTPTLMVVDVEGAEAELIRGALDVLRPDARLIIAFHSREIYETGVELLRDRGFRIAASPGILEGAGWICGDDPDVFFSGPEAEDWEGDFAILERAGYYRP